jgi:guanylate kinase
MDSMNSKLIQKIISYHPSASTIELIQQTPIIFLVGISGAGKDSIKQKLLESGKYHHIVSHTTRQPRLNRGVMEQDGREYHFIDLAEAERLLDDKAFVEAKMYSGNLYGTSVAEIQKAQDEGKIALTDIEVQGVAAYKTLAPNIKAAFILPPSYEVWQERLKKRYGGTIDQADYLRRMQTATLELNQLLTTDYYKCFINDSLDKAVAEVDHFATSGKRDPILEAEAREVAKELLK